MVGIRGKKMNFCTLKFLIEEIYSLRFIKDTFNLKNQLNRKIEIAIKDSFPLFVLNFILNKYNKKSLTDRHGLDLLITVDYYRYYSKDVEIFAKFLDETYDTDDLIFFLFVRSCIEKEMKINFLQKAKEELNSHYNEENSADNDISLTNKICIKSIV